MKKSEINKIKRRLKVLMEQRIITNYEQVEINEYHFQIIGRKVPRTKCGNALRARILKIYKTISR